ncbi:MAG: hypothetical protein ACUVWR_14080, partial [Anaerolineae bacterium]
QRARPERGHAAQVHSLRLRLSADEAVEYIASVRGQNVDMLHKYIPCDCCECGCDDDKDESSCGCGCQ